MDENIEHSDINSCYKNIERVKLDWEKPDYIELTFIKTENSGPSTGADGASYAS